MNLQGHVMVSSAVGGVLAIAAGEPALLGVTVAAGVLPDADHFIDYFNWYVRRIPDRLILLFHGWEFLAAATLIYELAGTEEWVLAILIGYATHIVGDQLFNRPGLFTYFFTFRTYKKFRWEGVTKRRSADTAYMALLDSVPPLRHPLQSWFESRSAGFPDPSGNENGEPRNR